MTTDFSARGPYLGYLYQVRYALFLLLASDRLEAQLYLEKLDDIDLGGDGKPDIEIIQLKHSTLEGDVSLSDHSTEFWKTIRIWSEHLKSGQINSDTILTLVTTKTIPTDSVLNCLRPKAPRDVVIAQKLLEIAKNSKNEALRKAFDAFCALTDLQREILVKSIRILDQSPDINDVEEFTKRKLTVHSQYRNSIYQDLEGWWFKQVVLQLTHRRVEPLRRTEVDDQIAYINDKYAADNLPIHFADAVPADPIDVDNDRRQFVEQLRLISLSRPRIEYAIRDYYRAFEQRSRWLQDKLVILDELSAYEKRLVEEWGRCRAFLAEEMEDELADDDGKIKFGKALFNKINEDTTVRIRPKVEEPYVMRGSYHILADRCVPQVSWHPEFIDRLRNIIDPSDLANSKWEERPIEVANLLNPAFCSVLVYEAIKGYCKEATAKSGMSLALVFLVFPIILYKSTRDTLPASMSTKLHAWLQNNPQVLPLFEKKVEQQKAITREALMFGLQQKIIEFNAQGHLLTVPNKRLEKISKLGPSTPFPTDADAIRKRALFIGRWFGRAGTVESIYSWWGIKP